jgi:hypothetical protein
MIARHGKAWSCPGGERPALAAGDVYLLAAREAAP